MRSKYTVAVTEKAPVKLERCYSFSGIQYSFPKVRFRILILSSIANIAAVPICSLVRKEVFGTTAHLANYQNGPTASLLEWRWGWKGFHSHTDHSQNPCHIQSQKLSSDIGSIFPKAYCARKAQNTQNAHLNYPRTVNSWYLMGLLTLGQ